jgi:hypothetical protein
VREPGVVESLADRADHAVHHPAGGDHVGSGLRVADALLGEVRQRGVVVDVELTAVVVKDAAVAVVGVFAEALVRPSSFSALEPVASLNSRDAEEHERT